MNSPAKILLFVSMALIFSQAQSRWSQSQANKWYNSMKWGIGINYTPAYADNEIEFWSQLTSDNLDSIYT